MPVVVQHSTGIAQSGLFVLTYPAMFSEEHLVRFQALYKDHFGKEISKEDALKRGLDLVFLVEMVLRHSAQQKIQQEENKTDNAP